MTLSKLAQLANVSVAVVSKAFSGREDVSEAMREHVFAVAREHGCFAQFYHARYDKPVIAVIIPEAISQFYIHYIEVLKKDIEENGYTMLLSIYNFDNALKDELVRYFTHHGKVDGLILVGATFPDNDKCDTVLISTTHHQGRGASVVSLDARKGIDACLDALLEAGHRRIGYVGEAYTLSRRKRLMEQVAAHGLAVDESLFYTSRLRFADAGRDGVRHLFSLPEPPTAILGAYGYITQGILAALAERGLRVPEDISVVSLDNDPSPIHPQLDIACVPSDTERICAGAIQILRQRLGTSSPNENPICIHLDATFHKGQSIGETS